MIARAFLRAALALALAWATLAVAVARGEAGAVAVICAGGGLLAVPLDAEGRPAPDGHAQACPDGTLSFAPALASLPLPAAPLRLLRARRRPPLATPAPRAPRLRPQARGPPRQA